MCFNYLTLTSKYNSVHQSQLNASLKEKSEKNVLLLFRSLFTINFHESCDPFYAAKIVKIKRGRCFPSISMKLEEMKWNFILQFAYRKHRQDEIYVTAFTIIKLWIEKWDYSFLCHWNNTNWSVRRDAFWCLRMIQCDNVHFHASNQ